MRKKIEKKDKKKILSISIDPRVLKLWEQYCEDNEIENYSEYIELLLQQKIKTTKNKNN
jgi:metal-responsive CopG/Arc/MetJ family transcriptional regulator